MERTINAYQVTPNLTSLNQTIRKFLRMEHKTTGPVKTFEGRGGKITVSLDTAVNPDQGKNDYTALRLIFEHKDETLVFITHPYIDANFTGKVNEIYENLTDDTVGDLEKKILFRNDQGNMDLFRIENILKLFKADEAVLQDRPGFERAVPLNEDMRSRHEEDRFARGGRRSRRGRDQDDREDERSGYRERFGRRNSEDHRRMDMDADAVARRLLLPVLGSRGVSSFMRDHGVVGNIETHNVAIENLDDCKIITMVVQIKIEEI